MKEVYIKYNPYRIETDITVDGKSLAENSHLGESISSGIRLQEWIEELPQNLIDEYNDREFNIEFYGTLLDFEDLTEVFNKYCEQGQLTVKLNRKPAKESQDKEKLIDCVFEKIQNGPFSELRDVEIINAFEHAKSSDFEVCVVATMSAGKSTLINSMLRTKLMPSKQEACTSIITKLKDNDSPHWQAEVYNKENRLIEAHENLSISTMERLNSDENVSVIKATGNIPFVTADDVSLILIDTPGPNNSRDPEHKRVQSEFLNKSSKSLVLYIMEGTFGTDDDNALLERVAESMSVGGKQSKDRFIFVVNKMDNRNTEDGDTSQTLTRVRTYLKKHGIINPNLFPAAALPALNIRRIKNGEIVDEDTADETELKVKKLNRNENFHFETYASLPASIRGEINRQLSEASINGDLESQALIHTGVVSIEAAIRQYVQKYAKTAKIKNIVDTFIHKLDALNCLENTKKELASRLDQNKEIVKQIELIEHKISDVKEAKAFEDSVEQVVLLVDDEAKNVVEEIIMKFQAKIRNKIDELRGKEIEIALVEHEVSELAQFARRLEPNFQAELDELIKNNLIKSSQALLKTYRDKLISLTDELEVDSITGISIEPLKFMEGDITPIDSFSIEHMVQSKKVENGREWIENTNKKWYKPWTWFQERGYYRKKYKTVKYIDAGELADEYLSKIQTLIYDNGENTIKYATKQSVNILRAFKKEFEKLDNILKEKLNQLKSYATDRTLAEARIQESEERLEWLESIKAEVESILDI